MKASRKIYLSNSFSIQMLKEEKMESTNVGFRPVKPEEVPADAISCIGHLDTANVVSSILGRRVECNRASILLEEGDVLYVAQVTGGRLPEGATELPEGTTLKFFKVVPYVWDIPY